MLHLELLEIVSQLYHGAVQQFSVFLDELLSQRFVLHFNIFLRLQSEALHDVRQGVEWLQVHTHVALQHWQSLIRLLNWLRNGCRRGFRYLHAHLSVSSVVLSCYYLRRTLGCGGYALLSKRIFLN